MESYLRGVNGKETIYVDNMGKVIETTDRIEPLAGNDLYLTIDHDLQVATYDILEQKLAGILVAKIINSKSYVVPENPSASSLYIPVDDVYFALINNNVIDISQFDDVDALTNESKIYSAFLEKQEKTFQYLNKQLYEDFTAYKKLPTEYQIYQSYIVSMLKDYDVLMSGNIGFIIFINFA